MKKYLDILKKVLDEGTRQTNRTGIVPFNIASYALLTHLVAYVTDLKVGTFVHTMHDAHIYVNHLDQVKEQLQRSPRSLPELEILEHTPKDILSINYSHLSLSEYNPYPTIKGAVAK